MQPPPEFQELIDEKKFDALESALDEENGRGRGRPPALLRRGGGGQEEGRRSGGASGWLRFLADYHDDAADEPASASCSRSRACLPTDPQIRKDLAAALQVPASAPHPAFAGGRWRSSRSRARRTPPRSAGRIARWLRFHPDEIYFLPGRGAGRLVEMKPALDVMRLDSRGREDPALARLGGEEPAFRCPRATSCGARSRTRSRSPRSPKRSPPDALRQLLASFGGPLTMQEVKDHLVGDRAGGALDGVLDGGAQAQAGARRRAAPSRRRSPGARARTPPTTASGQAFEKAAPAAQIDLARKHAKRSKELARFMGDGARGARRGGSAPDSPALAWELSQAAAPPAAGRPRGLPGGGAARSPTCAQGSGRHPRSSGPGEGPRGHPRVAGPTGPRSSSSRSAARRTRAS